MKTCSGCKTSKPLVEFSVNKTKKDGLQTQCMECNRQYSRAHYSDNKRHYLDRNSKVKERNRRFLFDYLSKHSCVDCPETDPIVLTFDHVRGDKLFNLAEAGSRQFSIQTIEAEIMKCEVRCFNCHARKTAKDFGWYANFLQPATNDKA